MVVYTPIQKGEYLNMATKLEEMKWELHKKKYDELKLEKEKMLMIIECI